VSEDTAEKLCDIMEYYVSDASGNKAYVPGYRVGGKTGTANLVDGGRTYSGKDTNTSFVAMAPMDDPQISMIVIVYSPTKIHFGNFTAGPIVKEIMTNSLQYLGVEPEYTDEEAEEIEENSVDVPDVTGMDSSDAIRQLEYYGLDYIVVPETNSDKNFVVLDQFPKEGKTVAKGSTVYLYSD
jgi:stage V sporulation protein D (sporulation-specific penicillin-binding protein)